MRTALEVRQTYCDTHLDTRHFRSGSVGIGSKVAWKWRFLGVDMGTVPEVLRYILPYAPPIWSECEPVETAHFQTDEDLGLDRFFIHADDTWYAVPPKGWLATQDGVPFTGRAEVTGKVEICRGDVRFTAAMVPAPVAQPRTLPDPDPPFTASLGMMAASGCMLALAVFFAPAGGDVITAEIPDRFVHVQVETPAEKETPAPKPKLTSAPAPSGGSPGSGTGSPDPTTGGSPDAKQQDINIAMSAGLFSGGDPFAGLDGPDLLTAAEGLVGSIGGNGPAIGIGLNGRGDSLGGGGDGEGIDIGVTGGGDRLGYGGPGGGGPGKRVGVIAQTSDPLVIGSMNPEDIDRVIKKHLSGIRYCYQRQLQRTPGLAGKLVTKFTIAKDGTVSSASVKSSSLGNAAVEQCVVGRIQKMKFVAPQGGGIAIVSYPFMFSPG